MFILAPHFAKVNTVLRKVTIVIAVIVIALLYRYDRLLFERPQSVHNWRQSDCASLTLNYYQQDLPFWKPHIHGLVSKNGTSGINAPSELPLYYWGIAQLYRLFDSKEEILRTSNTLLFLAGIYAFINCLYLLSGQLLWSILLGLLLFTSPVLVYYGNNFLTNAPSFGMALCGLNSFVALVLSGKRKYWWWTLLFFFLAASLKITGLYLFLCIGLLVLLGYFVPQFRSKYPGGLVYLLSLLIILIPVISWIWYARQLNEANNTTYFSTTTFGIWMYDREEVSQMLQQMFINWKSQVFHPATSGVFLLLFLFILLKLKKMRPVFIVILISLIIGFSLYFLLQFYTFVDHDYYTINMYILPALLLLMFTDHLRQFKPLLMRPGLISLFLGLLLAGNVIYAREQLQWRYNSSPNDYRSNNVELYDNIEAKLLKAEVSPVDTVIYIPDNSHTSLYLLNRYGWTDHKMAMPGEKYLLFNRTEEGIRESIRKGAKFLLINGIANFYQREYLHPFTYHLAGRFGELFIFDLRENAIHNFTLPEPKVLWSVYHDFDDTTNLRQVNDNSLTTEYSRQGKSLKSSPNDQFMASVPLPEVKTGQTIRVEVWLYSEEEMRAVPVIQSEESGLVFQAEYDVVSETSGWKKLRQEITISPELAHQGVKVFLWNPSGSTVYFDDYRVEILDRNPLME